MGEKILLAVSASNVVFVLMASIQTVRSTTRVGFTSRSYPALRATLSQDSAWSGPRWRYFLYRQLSIFIHENRPGRNPAFGG